MGRGKRRNKAWQRINEGISNVAGGWRANRRVYANNGSVANAYGRQCNLRAR